MTEVPDTPMKAFSDLRAGRQRLQQFLDSEIHVTAQNGIMGHMARMLIALADVYLAEAAAKAEDQDRQLTLANDRRAARTAADGAPAGPYGARHKTDPTWQLARLTGLMKILMRYAGDEVYPWCAWWTRQSKRHWDVAIDLDQFGLLTAVPAAGQAPLDPDGLVFELTDLGEDVYELIKKKDAELAEQAIERDGGGSTEGISTEGISTEGAAT